MAAIRGEGPRVLIVSAPPRHGKSEYYSKYLPTWFLGRYPDKRVILTSHTDHLARNFGRSCRDLMLEYGGWFGVSVDEDASAANAWNLAHPHIGGMVTAGVGGPITGRGADLLIIDDPIKNAEEAISETIRENQWDWFRSTAWTRLEPGGVTVLMMTRWHEDDLSGRMKERLKEDVGVPYRELTLPALADSPDDPLGRKIGEPLWPERLSMEFLARQKLMLGEYWWGAMYQQRPGQYGEAEWPDEYFAEPFWTDLETWPDEFEAGVVAVDPSKGKDTGDYCAIVFVGVARGLYWVDSLVGRWPATGLLKNVLTMAERLRPDKVGIESNNFQELLASELDRLTRELHLPPLPIALINNTTNKELRIGRLGPHLARHHFRFLNNPSNRLLVSQVKAFPQGDYDDGPDALEMAVRLIRWLTYQRTEGEF